jgi:hypothetical protein
VSVIVHFNKETDVILLIGYGMNFNKGKQYHFPDFAEQITQPAISATLGYNPSPNDSS